MRGTSRRGRRRAFVLGGCDLGRTRHLLGPPRRRAERCCCCSTYCGNGLRRRGMAWVVAPCGGGTEGAPGPGTGGTHGVAFRLAWGRETCSMPLKKLKDMA